MEHSLGNFWCEDVGQDMVEYALLLAFVAVAVIGMVGNFTASVSTITSGATSELVCAGSAARGSS
jgi:Flp pilus assembly pilin Flp